MIDTVVWLSNVAPPVLCASVLEEQSPTGWNEAVIGMSEGGVGEDRSIRQSAVIWLLETDYLSRIMRQVISDVNASHFGFDLTSFELVQLTRYLPGDHYRWHQDQFWPQPGQETKPVAQRTIRKLSVCLQLTDEHLYQGGQLLLQEPYGKTLNGSERGENWRLEGSCIVFPSVFQHSVTPVLTGTRYSAVLWASGPAWR